MATKKQTKKSFIAPRTTRGLMFSILTGLFIGLLRPPNPSTGETVANLAVTLSVVSMFLIFREQ